MSCKLHSLLIGHYSKFFVQTLFYLRVFRLFVVLCGYPHKNQCDLELKIILSIENDEEPVFICHNLFSGIEGLQKEDLHKPESADA